MYERQTNKIVSNLCTRCEKAIETWEHVWDCTNNTRDVNEIMIKTIIELEDEYRSNNKLEELELIRKSNIDFISICNEPSHIMIDGSKVWEIIKGVFNNKFNNCTTDNKVRNMTKEISMRHSNFKNYLDQAM